MQHSWFGGLDREGEGEREKGSIELHEIQGLPAEGERAAGGLEEARHGVGTGRLAERQGFVRETGLIQSWFQRGGKRWGAVEGSGEGRLEREGVGEEKTQLEKCKSWTERCRRWKRLSSSTRRSCVSWMRS